MSEEDTVKPKRNSFRRFLVPEDSITLRVIFDNAKNYALCSAIFVITNAVWRSVSEDPSMPLHRFIIGAILLILVLLSVLQSLEIWLIASQRLKVRVQQNGRSEKGTLKGFVRSAVYNVIISIIVVTMGITLLYGVTIGLSVVIASQIQNVELGDKKLAR